MSNNTTDKPTITHAISSSLPGSQNMKLGPLIQTQFTIDFMLNKKTVIAFLEIPQTYKTETI